jgi:hypothetical protein
VANIDKWAINESLLQAYRSTFISSQSFFLAVGAITLNSNAVLVYLTAAVGMFVIWFVWFPVVRARHRIVDYYKFSSDLSEAERPNLCSEDEYVQNLAKRTRANELFKLKTNWRRTRIKLDIGMPVLFTIVWMALVISKALEL